MTKKNLKKVVITMKGGYYHIDYEPKDVEVIIKDYDTDGCCGERKCERKGGGDKNGHFHYVC